MISASGATIGSRTRIGRSSMRQKATTGRAGALGAEARERLRVAPVEEGRDREQLGGGDDALAAAAVDAHGEHCRNDLPPRGPAHPWCRNRAESVDSPHSGGRRSCDARHVELADVAVTPLHLERFDDVLDAEGAERPSDTIARGRALLAGRIRLERELDRARRRRGRDAAVADRLRAGRRSRRALGRRRRATPSSSRSPSAFTTACTASTTACRWRPSARLRALVSTPAREQLVARRRSARHRAPPRPADRRHGPARARDGRPGRLARAHRPRPPERRRARGLAVPDPVRRGAPTRSSSRGASTPGRVSTRTG